jgi:CelD/BcsL family acetyltransferase involved in cellulose biosynthesis
MAAACVDAPAALNLHAAWIHNAAEFAQMQPAWRELFTRSGQDNAFLTFAWMFTWWKHFAKGRLAIIAIREPSGRLVAVAPFHIAPMTGALGARRLGFLADAHVGSDYLDALADPAYADLAGAEIARTLLSHHALWDYIELRDAAESPLMTALLAGLVRAGMKPEQSVAQLCNYMPLPPTFDRYLSRVAIGLRANYRRRWRNLQRDHQGECLIFQDARDLQTHFPSLLALHRMRFAQRQMHSAFVRPGLPEFHVDALQSLAAEGLARLFLLQAGGEPVAAIYGFAAGTTFQFYQCGMHPEWMRYGVGQVLIGNVIEHVIANGHRTFDFLRGGESYKAQWAAESRRTVTWRLFDRRPSSRAARMGLGANAALRAIARALRRRFRQYMPAIRQH